MYRIVKESAEHLMDREVLLDRVMGYERHTKPSYAYRPEGKEIKELSLLVFEDDILRGTIRYWPICVETHPALLLGPLAVDIITQGSGVGSLLMRESLNKALSLGYSLVLLVGDFDYYKRFGFQPATPFGIRMAELQDSKRLLLLELEPNAASGVMGLINTQK